MIRNKLQHQSVKSGSRVLLLLLLSVFWLGAGAQVTVTIPVNNDNDYEENNPYGASNAYHRTQALYKASEIGMSGNITKVGFFVNETNNPAPSTPVVIKMRNTMRNSVIPGAYDDVSANAVTVFSGAVLNTQLNGGSWVIVTLNTPFTYAGHNLEVFVETNMGSPSAEDWEAKIFRWSDVSYAAGQTWSMWSTPPGPQDIGYVMPRHPNVKFEIVSAPAMSYASSTVTGVVRNTIPGATRQSVMGIQVDMAGLQTPLSATSFTLSTNGSSPSTGLIQNARLYYTGISPDFDTITPFGSVAVNPGGTFSITSSQTLQPGTNYFWLTYDVSSTALVGDSVDAECTQIIVNGVTHTPSVTAAPGSVIVGRKYDFEAATDQAFSAASLNWNPNQWERGVPTYGPSSAFSGTSCWGTDLDGNLERDRDYVLVTPPYIARTNNVIANYREWYDLPGWNAEAWLEYEVNNSGSWNLIRSINTNSQPTSNGNWLNTFVEVPANTGDTIRLRWHIYSGQWISLRPGWYIDDFVISGAATYNQSYVFGTTNQVMELAYEGERNKAVVGVYIETSGTEAPLSLSSLNFTTGLGSSAILDSARVYYTGSRKSFDTLTQFGSTIATPSGPFVVIGTQELVHGANHFWLAYDIASSASIGDSVDATCTQINIGAATRTPDETDPEGSLPIGRLYNFDVAGYEDFSTTSFTARASEWQKGTPSDGPGAAYSGSDCWGTNLTGDYSQSADYELTSPTFIAGSDIVSASYMQWFDFSYTNADVRAEFQYQVNNGGWSVISMIDNSTYANSASKWENIFNQVFVNPGDTVQFRWYFWSGQWASQGPGWYIDNFVMAGAAPFSQSFASANSRAVFGLTAAGKVNQPVAAISVNVIGTENALPVTEIKFNTNGTGTVSAIKKAKVFYTGTSNVFDTTTQFGTEVNTPNGLFAVTGSQTLAMGTNYFWLTYDIESTAVLHDSVDAEVTEITVAGIPRVPDETAPEGSVAIGTLYDFEAPGMQDFLLMNFGSTPNEWEKGTPTYGPSVTYSGTNCWGTDLDGDIEQSSDYTLQTPPYVITSQTVNSSFRQWFDFGYTNADITASMEYEVNNGGWNPLYTVDNAMFGNSSDKWENIETSMGGMTPGDTIRFRWHFSATQWASISPGWYIDDVMISGVGTFSQFYVQSYVSQAHESTLPGKTNQAVANVMIEMNGSDNPKTLTDLNLSMNGSTPGIVNAARIYYTGASKDFDTTTQFGSTVVAPGIVFTVNGSQALAAGANHFWVAYDISPSALAGDSVDAEITQITVSGVTDVPQNSVPQGSVPVARVYDFETAGLQNFTSVSLNGGTSEWEKGVPTYGPAGAYSGTNCWGTDLDGDFDQGVEYALVSPPFKALSDASYISYHQWFDFDYWNYVDAIFQYNINGSGWSDAVYIDNQVRESSDNNWERMTAAIPTVAGDTVQFRWYLHNEPYSNQAPGWYIDNFGIAGLELFDQGYKESYSEQVMGIARAGAKAQAVLSVTVDVAGSENPLDVTLFNFGSSGTTGAISAARLFYTGSRNQFDTTVQYGTTVSAPGTTFGINGSQELEAGRNYFWLTYDLNTTVVNGDSVDATFTQLTIGASTTHTPTVTDPAGVLPVGIFNGFENGAQDFSAQSLSARPNEWEMGVPVPGTGGPATAYEGANCWGTNLEAYYTLKSTYALLTPPYVARQPEMTISFRQWYDFIITAWDKRADFQYEVNNSGSWITITSLDIPNKQSSDNKWLEELQQVYVNTGDTVRFRWSIYTGDYEPGPGWYIDNVNVSNAELLDALPPEIQYTPIAHTTSTASMTLTDFAKISDITGVSQAPGTAPRIYYKKSSEADVFLGNSSADNGWKYVETSSFASPYSFLLDYSLLNSALVTGDTIEYFVAAQDVATPVHVSARPSAGFSATAVNAVTSAPSSPSFFVIIGSPMSGNYDVGPGQVYTTLTAAVTDLNLRGISGPVTFSLTAGNYSTATGETFPITFLPVNGASATNTVTVKPSATNTVTFTAGNAVFKLQGADHIIIDGSNNGSTSRDMTLQSTNSPGLVWLCANSAQDGARYNTVRNLNIIGNYDTKFGVYSGHADYTSFRSRTQAPASFNVIENNFITKTIYGIGMVGNSVNRRDSGNVFVRNQFGDATTWVMANAMFMTFSEGGKVTENNIVNLNFNSQSSFDGFTGGIFLDQAKRAEITRNKVTNWRVTAGDVRMVGIYVYGGEDGYDRPPLPTNNLIANNFVAGGHSLSTEVYDMTGMAIYAGNGDRVYFNSISFNGTVLLTDGQVRAFTIGDNNMLNSDVRNNIFQVNTTSLVNTSFGGYISYLDFSANGAISDYNVISVTTGGAAQGFIGQYNYNQIYSLADWQAVTGSDANSKDGLVTFAAANDLHVAGPSIGDIANLKGESIAGFGTDIDGDARTAGAPYIGADENTSAPLPVKLLEFKGKGLGNDVLLTWSTASEINNKGFAVERSLDNQSFKAIGFVNGKGNASSVTAYSYTDNQAFAASNVWYYRLKQLDKDGRYAYSRSVRVSRSEATAGTLATVFPNPFNKEVFVQFESEDASPVQVMLTDLAGRTILRNTLQAVQGTNTLNVLNNEELEAGIYFLTIEANGKRQVQKLVKQ